MPIYEYACESCGQITEKMQKMSDPGPESCDSCQKGPMVKIMSRTGFILKGSGWYVTDFRDSKKKAPPAPTGTTDSSSSPGGQTTEKETAPVAKETKSEGASSPATSPASVPPAQTGPSSPKT